MCGIFGAVGRRQWLSTLRIEQGVGRMTHRGPDGSGVWWSPPSGGSSEGEETTCAFGHRRLAIIDLSDAALQPMTSADARHALVYNGEIYNFREIREDLERLGERFSSSGDTEVVLKALVRWGEPAVERFRGMFALGFWDQHEKKLLLVRDRLGVKPLYWAETPAGIAFASEVRTLLAASVVPRVLSASGLRGYMRFGSLQDPDTLVSGIRALPPGAMLAYDGVAVSERRYWAVPNPVRRRETRQEAVSGIRALLNEAVRMRLVSDVPFGVFLSGGGDSSALAALAAAESGVPIHTFTVVFDEAAYSEEAFASETAGRFGCVHHAVRVTGQSAAADLPDALRGQDQPSGDGLNTWLVSRAARKEGLSMALSGLGGDEVFGGYSHFRRFGRLTALSRAASLVPAGVRALLEARAARTGAAHKLRKATAVVNACGSTSGVYGAIRALLTDGQIRDLATPPAWEHLSSAGSCDQDAGMMDDSVNVLSRLELAGYLRNTLLRDTDAMSMASSLEVRVPFLDHKLVEYVLTLPGHMKTSGRGNKALLFEAVPELPRSIGSRKKMGFVLPLPTWFRGPMKATIEDTLLGLPGPSSRILRREPLAAAWQSFLEGEGRISATRIFALASLVAWVAEHDLELPW